MSSESTDPSVVIVTQYFDPDTAGISTLLSDLAPGLVDRGLDVSVVTTQPSYTSDDRATKQPSRETIDGVEVRRVPATRFDRTESVTKHILNELTFFLAAFVYLAVRRRGDVLLLPTSPSFLPIAGWPLQLRGYRPVPIVMDFYPPMAVALDYIDSDSPVRHIWDWLNRRAYHCASVTLTIGETMAERVRHEYGSIPIRVIHNWEDGDIIEPRDKSENEFANEHGFDEQLTVLYSGNLGAHHELESVLDAAESLEADEVSSFRFVFIGDGAKKETLQRIARERSLESVTFLPYQPTDVLPRSLTAGDVSLVTMEPRVEGLCVPSKLYTALASGQAILAVSTANAELSRTVERADCGLRVEPGDSEAIEAAVRFWLDNPDRVEEMGTAARDVFESQYTRDIAIDAYETVVRAVASTSTDRPPEVGSDVAVPPASQR